MSEPRYPHLMSVLQLIALDNGGINRGRSAKSQERQSAAWLDSQVMDLAEIEAWLGALTDEERDLVASGGQDEPETQAVLARAPAFTDDLLNRYFDEVC